MIGFVMQGVLLSYATIGVLCIYERLCFIRGCLFFVLCRWVLFRIHERFHVVCIHGCFRFRMQVRFPFSYA